MCPLPTHPYAQPPSEPLALVFLIHAVVVLTPTNPALTRSSGCGQPLTRCSGKRRPLSTLSMMLHVFYTRQAYVRTFMKDILDHPDLQNHRSRRFTNEFHLTESANLLFVGYRIVPPCIAALTINLFVGSQKSPYYARNRWKVRWSFSKI